MNCQEKLFPETMFGGFANLDGTIAFYLRVNALIKPSNVVLDVGCGRGQFQDDPIKIRRDVRVLRGKAQKVIGLDLDVNAANNPFIDEFRLLESSSSRWPIEDQSIDLILTDWTLEHVPDPDLFFREAHRVLKPGGYFCARTTNAWGYVALMSRIIPQNYHKKIIQKVQKIRKEDDIFPAHYSCNTIPLLRRKLSQFGFAGIVLAYAGLPAYANFSCLLYYIGYLYEKFTFHFLRHTLMVFALKE
jgi:SAM-dependent methyltransferase